MEDIKFDYLTEEDLEDLTTKFCVDMDSENYLEIAKWFEELIINRIKEEPAAHIDIKVLTGVLNTHPSFNRVSQRTTIRQSRVFNGDVPVYVLPMTVDEIYPEGIPEQLKEN